MNRKGLLVLAALLSACQASSINSIARNTRLVDLRFADEYAAAADECLDANETREGYDACMVQWQTAAHAVRILIASALALDVADSRDHFEDMACRWYRALQMVQAVSPTDMPSVVAGLESKWKRKCGK